jgi:transposase
MSSGPDSPSRDPDVLLRLLAEERALRVAAEEDRDRYKARCAHLTKLLHGRRSERMLASAPEQGMLDLGDLADVEAVANDNGSADERARRRPRTPASRNIGRLPLHLPRIEVVIEPEECGTPGCARVRIGEEITEALDVVPAILRVIRTVRPIYACSACTPAILQAAAPERAVTGGMATNALLAFVVVARFSWHLPYYRQAGIFRGQGVALDPETLCRWAGRVAWWLRPLYEVILGHIRSQDVVYCDETRMPRIDPGRGKTKTCQMWLQSIDQRPWGGPAAPAVGYVFSDSRSAAAVARQLAGFSGTLQVDGYTAYKTLVRLRTAEGRPIRLAFCMAHARRRFVDVYEATRSEAALAAITKIRAIYAVEARIRGRSPQERLAVRRAESAPLMEDLKSFAAEVMGQISRKSSLAQAIAYLLRHWDGLCVFLEDGRVEVDNNAVEREVKPVALGRRNSLFAGSREGGETWAVLATLINTAKLNGVDPLPWLTDVLDAVVTGRVTINAIHRLTPWAWEAERRADAERAA